MCLSVFTQWLTLQPLGHKQGDRLFNGFQRPIADKPYTSNFRKPNVPDTAGPAQGRRSPSIVKNITVLLNWSLVVYCLDYMLCLYNEINRLEEQMGNLAIEQQQSLECV